MIGINFHYHVHRHNFTLFEINGKFLLPQAIKAYRGSRGIAPLILDLDALAVLTLEKNLDIHYVEPKVGQV
jgi:hypothetical protein